MRDHFEQSFADAVFEKLSAEELRKFNAGYLKRIRHSDPKLFAHEIGRLRQSGEQKLQIHFSKQLK
jgi:hypothetical protein